jgi:hypothetical protein
MFNRHHTSTVRHRHRLRDPGSSPRIFLARDWIHIQEEEIPCAPLGRAGVDQLQGFQPPALGGIVPVPEGVPRPRFSVMLPTYEPDHRLGRSLAAVLAQAPDPAAMQIAVVDDGSRQVDVRALVRSFEIDAAATQDDRLVLAAEWSPDQRHVALLGPAGLVLRPVAVASTAEALRTRLTALRTRGPMPW